MTMFVSTATNVTEGLRCHRRRVSTRRAVAITPPRVRCQGGTRSKDDTVPGQTDDLTLRDGDTISP